MPELVMSPKELAAAMVDIAKGGDEEIEHERVDDLMADLLRKLGYGEAMDIYMMMAKWYA